MKQEYNYLDELTEKSNKYKVKVKVIQKARPHQSPGKKKIQRLLLEDDKGNTMRGTIFDTDIPSFEDTIVRNGEYEIEDALIQKVPDEINKDGNPYQMNFNPNIKLTPITSDPDVGKPHYIKFSEIPRTQGSKQELIDIVGVVLFIEKTRDISIGPATQRVRELVLTDNSVSSPRTLVLSAWNDFADNDIQAITKIDSSLPIIGVTALRTTTHKGFSVASTISSTIIAEPTGDLADTLRKRAADNGASLVQLQNQVLQARSETKEHSITPIVTLKAKKAINTLQEEKHWIKVYVPNAAYADLFVYIGCSNCGRKGDAIVGETYKCMRCNEHEAKGVPRAAFKIDFFDSTSTHHFTIFTKEIKSLFQQSMEAIYGMYIVEDKSLLFDAIDNIRATEFRLILMQVSPAIALNRSNLMAWVIKKIKVA